MRLTKHQTDAIKASFADTFHKGEIYLFGSRTDDSKKGGDIDLFVIPYTDNDLNHKKIDFLVKLKRAIGEQKIDVVIDKGRGTLIEKNAKENGILLCRS